VARGSLRRFTMDPSTEGGPTWSPDGSSIAFHSTRRKGGGNGDLYQKSVNGSEPEVALLETVDNVNMLDWSPDGRFVAYTVQRRQHADRDIWVLSLKDRKSFPIAQTDFEENGARFSPDSRWIVYTSTESGRTEIYVQPFPGPGNRVPVSSNGGENL